MVRLHSVGFWMHSGLDLAVLSTAVWLLVWRDSFNTSSDAIRKVEPLLIGWKLQRSRIFSEPKWFSDLGVTSSRGRLSLCRSAPRGNQNISWYCGIKNRTARIWKRFLLRAEAILDEINNVAPRQKLISGRWDGSVHRPFFTFRIHRSPFLRPHIFALDADGIHLIFETFSMKTRFSR